MINFITDPTELIHSKCWDHKEKRQVGDIYIKKILYRQYAEITDNQARLYGIIGMWVWVCVFVNIATETFNCHYIIIIF